MLATRLCGWLYRSAGPSLSRLKYLNNCGIDWYENVYKCPEDQSKLIWWSSDFSSSATSRLKLSLWYISTIIKWIAIKLGSHICVVRTTWNNFDHVTLHPAETIRSKLQSNTLIYDQIMTFPSASAVLCVLTLAFSSACLPTDWRSNVELQQLVD